MRFSENFDNKTETYTKYVPTTNVEIFPLLGNFIFAPIFTTDVLLRFLGPIFIFFEKKNPLAPPEFVEVKG